MKRISIFILISIISLALFNSCGTICKKKAAAKRIAVVLSCDGFRADYIDKAHTPAIDSIIKVGTSGALQPSYPSQTFPNHYTLATGLYPNDHGIVANSFYAKGLKPFSIGKRNSSTSAIYYGGEPIWNTVEKAGKKAICYYWVGSEAPIQNMHPSKYFYYNSHVPFKKRADYIMNAINKGGASQPDLAMLYIDQPDHCGHKFGPSSKECRKEVEKVDKFIGYLLKLIRESPYRNNIDFFLVSDHGMADIKHHIRLLDYVKPNEMEHHVTGSIGMLYLKKGVNPDEIIKRFDGVKGIKAYKRYDVPARFHFGSNCRIGDIVLIPEVSYYLDYDKPTDQRGSHGYDNAAKEMRAIFACFGPDIRRNKKLKKDFKNVNFYPLLCKILNVKMAENDGSMQAVDSLLSK